MKEKIYSIKFTKGQSEKIIELCNDESARINREFLERLHQLQSEIQQLYINKMDRDAELSSIINTIKTTMEAKDNGEKNTKNGKKTINKDK